MEVYPVEFDVTYAAVPEVVQGESLATALALDCAGVLAKWPDAAVTVLAQRPGEAAYPALVAAAPGDGGMLHYALTAYDTALPGTLRLEMRAASGDAVVKTRTYEMTVLPALAPGDAPPDPAAPDWVADVAEGLQSLTHAQAQAQASAARAKAYAGQAEDAAAASTQAMAAAQAGAAQAGQLVGAFADAEAQRAAQEAARQAAEGERTAAEQARAAAEARRQQDTDAAITAVDMAREDALAAAEQALCDGERAIAMVENALDDAAQPALRLAASRWAFAKVGNPVTVPAAPGSTLRVTADADCTVAHGASAYPLTAGSPWALTAHAGENTLTASGGTLTVEYNRESMDLLRALLPRAQAGGQHAVQLDGLLDDLPLGVQAGCVATQDGTPAPDAPVAVVGADSVTVQHTGKNLLPPLVKGVGISSTNGAETVNANGATCGYILISPEETYHVSGLTDALSGMAALYTADKRFIGRTSGTARTSITFTKNSFANAATGIDPSLGRFVRVTQYKTASNDGTVDDVDGLSVQMERGDAATAFEAYHGHTETITPAGTLWGLPGAEDTLDLARGILVRRTERQALRGDAAEGWSKSGSVGLDDVPLYMVRLFDARTDAHLPTLCSRFVRNQTALASLAAGEHTAYVSNGRLFLYFAHASEDVAAWQAWLAENPMDVVYELAESLAQPIAAPTLPAYAGVNTVYADAGGALLVQGCRTLAGTAP